MPIDTLNNLRHYLWRGVLSGPVLTASEHAGSPDQRVTAGRGYQEPCEPRYRQPSPISLFGRGSIARAAPRIRRAGRLAGDVEGDGGAGLGEQELVEPADAEAGPLDCRGGVAAGVAAAEQVRPDGGLEGALDAGEPGGVRRSPAATCRAQDTTSRATSAGSSKAHADRVTRTGSPGSARYLTA